MELIKLTQGYSKAALTSKEFTAALDKNFLALNEAIKSIQGSEQVPNLQTAVDELTSTVEAILNGTEAVPGVSVIYNDHEPLSSADAPSPANATYYIGNDFTYNYVGGSWKRTPINTF